MIPEERALYIFDPPGFNPDQIDILCERALDLGQHNGYRGPGPLWKLLPADVHPSTALYLCTTAARYLYAFAVGLIRPDLFQGGDYGIGTFAAYYARGIAEGWYRTPDDPGPCLLQGKGLTDSVESVVRPTGFRILSRSKDGLNNDAALIDAFLNGGGPIRETAPVVALVQESAGPSGGSHCVLIVRDESGIHRVIDTYYLSRNGQPWDLYWGPGRPRYLRHIYTWHVGLE